MEQLKRVKVVMLPTENKSIIALTGEKLVKINESNYSFSHIKSQHLYIISDDKIKENDWFIDDDCSLPVKAGYNKGLSKTCKKIIATTDTSLNGGMQNGKIYNHNFIGTKYEPLIIPQPSQQFIKKFIEEYNKGNIITDVLVEYEPGYVNPEWNKEKLKINPKDNTITIKKLKDSWNKEEVIELIKRFNSESAGNVWFDTDEKWIEENL